jgi:hypothetical protein
MVTMAVANAPPNLSLVLAIMIAALVVAAAVLTRAIGFFTAIAAQAFKAAFMAVRVLAVVVVLALLLVLAITG